MDCDLMLFFLEDYSVIQFWHSWLGSQETMWLSVSLRKCSLTLPRPRPRRAIRVKLQTLSSVLQHYWTDQCMSKSKDHIYETNVSLPDLFNKYETIPELVHPLCILSILTRLTLKHHSKTIWVECDWPENCCVKILDTWYLVSEWFSLC